MRTIFHSTIKTAAALFFAVVAIVSCKKDTLESRDLMVYLTGEYGSFNNSVVMPFLHTPIDIQGNRSIKLAVLSTREVPADVEVTVVPDNSLVESFNKDNGLTALPMPSNAYRIVNEGKRRITAGTAVSDSLEIEITDPSVLTDPSGYVLPLQISSVESSDAGIRASNNRRAAYVHVTYQYSNIMTGEAVPDGTVSDRADWQVQVSNITNNAPASNMLDGRANTVWRSSNSAAAQKWIELDMGSSKVLKGFRLSPNYTNRNENPTGIHILTSQDNVNWTDQGRWRGTAPAATSNAQNPELKGIGFITDVQARYVRFTIVSWVAGNRTGVAELDAIEQ